MASDEFSAETPRGAWEADDEAALVRKHNEGASLPATADGFETAQMGRTLDPTDDPNVDMSMSTAVDDHPEQPPTPPPAGGCVGSIKGWLAERKLEQNKECGMDPYVLVRLGRHGKEARTEAFLTTRTDPPDVYTNPKWNDGDERDLTVRRSANDRGEVIVEVYDEGLEKDRFIGSCHVHLGEFILHADTTDKWKHTLFHLYDQQDLDVSVGEDQRDAGGVHALVRWVPELGSGGKWLMDSKGRAKGVLKIKVLGCSDLRDVSALRISDITSFADTGSFQITFYVMTTFIVMFSLFYRYVIWANVNVDGEDSTPGLDSVLFVLTTFTTVGYGDHPQLLETTFERLITIAFIILGMAILGVTIGTWGDMIKIQVEQKKRRARERLLKKMRDKGVEVSGLSGSDDIRQQVITKLRKKFKESEIDEHLIQTEMGKALIGRFWKDELNKLLFGLAGLAGILWLGTAVFMYTEREECFVSDKLPQDADVGCRVGQVDPQTGLPNDGRAGRPMVGELISPGRTEQGLGVIDALYFTTVTASTVGYGDVTPQSWVGKLFAVVYIPIAVALMSKTVMSIALIPMEYRHLKLETYVLDQFGDELSAPDFVDLKSSVGVGTQEAIRKNDFTLAMLLRLGRVGKYDITRIEQIFARLDKDKTGVLDKRDVQDLLALQKERIQRGQIMAASHLKDLASGAIESAENPVAAEQNDAEDT